MGKSVLPTERNFETIMNADQAMGEELASQVINTADANVPSLTGLDASLTALRQELNAVIGI